MIDSWSVFWLSSAVVLIACCIVSIVRANLDHKFRMNNPKEWLDMHNKDKELEYKSSKDWWSYV